ncbi:urea transporter [Mucilaginibacter sp. SMC90]|uniref:urea transporter n=1 Tax=Mucilaginibacter sp. SMC90 TaxID=2929803 RepID=UPI001FB288D2|nr:urea transporter [Mucilaginibacter sp. SMC90]UOE51233.1 urea transporter [Mucilaginibacter sp. SMC90]
MKQIAAFIKPVLNSYSVLFFSQNRILGGILLLVSFFNPVSGFAGLCCVVISLLITKSLKLKAEDCRTGIYSFNSLLLGIAFGAFFQLNLMFICWLLVACCMVVITTVIISQRLGKIGLPMLSLPFVITFWLVLLASNSIFNTGLMQKSSSLLQEIYTGPGNLAGAEGYFAATLPKLLSLFFRSLSAILFQDHIIAGMLITIGILIHSRIAFSLLVISFLAACGFNSITHTYPEGISYYHLGANLMMASMAIGSFFTIPSVRSYLLAVFCIPLGFIIINALTALASVHALPVFSLPFCILNIGLLYFLMLTGNQPGLQLTTAQHYSPEKNLYHVLNLQNRLNDLKYMRLGLPFMGYWTVSQGYNGNITHKGEWGQALDFVITDDEQKTFQYPGTLPEHFYCFNKPVLACADGIVEHIVNHVEDNDIGDENLKENWGNTVVIRHAERLYSKLSHLKKNSIKVKPGDSVKQGDLLGFCGNSGRSPEPHLHFQLQATPYIGSKTLRYPFAYYFNKKGNQNSLESYAIPDENDVVCNFEIDTSLKKAFDLQPGFVAKLITENGITEDWEVFKDTLNQLFIYSKTTGAVAYFVNNGPMFYFTSFYGDRTSLLYYFYLAAYKVIFNDAGYIQACDELPLPLTNSKIMLWLQDFAAPFYRFISVKYQSSIQAKKTGLNIVSTQYQEIAGKKNPLSEATVFVDHGNLQGFVININGQHIKAQWSTEN